MRLAFIFSFITCIVFGQTPIKIQIDNITTVDSLPKRIFKVSYSITNVTDQPVSILLNTENFIPATAGSMKNAVFYRVYEDTNPIDAGGIFTYRLNDGIPINIGKNDSQKEIESAFKIYFEKRAKLQKEQLFQCVVRFIPNETKSYSKELYWDFERYKKQGDNEYYIEPEAAHDLQLLLIVLREEYESELTPEQFATLMNDKTLIKGVFTSEKYPINFRP